jgi:glycosyltransferase involved in cell wall biosynthesis
MAGWLAGVKTIIYTDHGRSFPDSWKTILLDRIYSRITHHVVAVSGQLAEYLHTVVRLDRRKIRVIINGIDTRSFVPLTSGVFHPVRRIGIIARLVPVKDVATLLRAFKLVREKFPGIRLDVVGDGPERGSLEILAEELSISSSVMFHGFRRDIAAVLQEIDIFVLSSRSEGTSITLLEAMAAGKPVVVTNVGGSSAVVENGVNGFLVPSQNVEYMAAALHQLVNDDDLRNKMSMNNIASVDRQYSIRSMVRSYEKLYG